MDIPISSSPNVLESHEAKSNQSLMKMSLKKPVSRCGPMHFFPYIYCIPTAQMARDLGDRNYSTKLFNLGPLLTLSIDQMEQKKQEQQEQKGTSIHKKKWRGQAVCNSLRRW